MTDKHFVRLDHATATRQLIKIVEPGSVRTNEHGKVTFEKFILCTREEAKIIYDELWQVIYKES